jgi:NAD(P)-dependent dehydrogenase (short-subunit alcohol dehydrogenase family)
MTSSAGGLKASANISNYIASKFGVVGLVRSLAMDLAPYGIRANTVCPTNVNTHLIDNLPTLRLFRPDLDEPTLEDALEPLKGCNILPIPWVTVEDIAAAVLWLASDESRYVTGIALPVDAGMTQK